MLNLVKLIDKAGGYVFGIKNQDNMASMMSCAAGADFEYFMYLFMAASLIDCLIPCTHLGPVHTNPCSFRSVFTPKNGAKFSSPLILLCFQRKRISCS